MPVSVAPGAVATVTNPIRPPTADEQSVIDAAEKQRASALSAALAQISAFLGRKPADADGDGSSGAPEFSADDMKIVDKVQRWLFLPSVNSQFWDCVQKFHDLVTQNQALGTLTHSVDTVSTDHAYVFNTDTSRGVFFSLNVYFKDNSDCQREVIVHEYFHYIVGPDHFYSTTQTDEAMKCPHHCRSSYLTWQRVALSAAAKSGYAISLSTPGSSETIERRPCGRTPSRAILDRCHDGSARSSRLH